MDMEFFGEAMKATGLKVVVIDEASDSPFQPLHPTLKKCKCGLICTRHLFEKHMDTLLAARRTGGEEPKAFWAEHGEVPLSQAEEL
jgi:hypothetical protein